MFPLPRLFIRVIAFFPATFAAVFSHAMMPPGAPATDSSGELPADVVSILSWRIGSSFTRGASTLAGTLTLVPAAQATRIQFHLYRIVAGPGSPAQEPIASSVSFVPARSPVWVRNPSVQVPFALAVPEDLPDGRYRLESSALPGQQLRGELTFDLTRGNPPPPVVPEKLSASGSGRDWEITIPKIVERESRLEAWFFLAAGSGNTSGALMATASYPIPGDTGKMRIRLPDEPRWREISSGILRFHIGETALASDPVPVSFTVVAPPDATRKPIAHGVYTRADGTRHYWHADDTHTLNWNGVPWIPFGGMFYLFPAKATLRERAAERVAIARHLDTLQTAGFRDLYVNAGVGLTSPEWFVQTVVDEFNRRGIHFGWQLTTGAKPFAAWEIYSSTSQGLIRARASLPGKLEAEIPQVPLTELLVIPASGAGSARRIPFSSAVKTVAGGMEIAQILESENSAKKQRVTLDIPDLSPGDYYVLANTLQQGKRVSNVWERLDETLAGLDWISHIDWGSGLRFFVDPECNEGGINNRHETVRVSSPSFETDYASWLRNRYRGDIAALAAAWSLPRAALVDFSQASRLVPFRDLDSPRYRQQNTVTLVDPQTGKIFNTTTDEGASWMDYLQAVRESYARKRDEIARYIKTRVNVPVIIKRVSPWVSTEGIPRSPGGIDGIGLELYPDNGSGVPYGGLSGRAEADLAAQTTWLLATELGYSAKPGNLGVRSWPDKATFERIVRETVSTGAKGIYLFGWRLPGKEWENHVLLDQPDRLRWASEIAGRLRADPPVAWTRYGLIFPEGQSWWWRSNGKLWTRYNCIYRDPPSVFSQSARLAGDGPDALWAVSSGVPVPDANPVVVNLADPYFAKYYTGDIDRMMDARKHVIYLGRWPAGADTPARLARHFSSPGQTLPLPGSEGEFQPLRLYPGDEALARDSSGNVWAKLNPRDRLLIVSATPAGPAARNSAQPPPHLKPEWITRLLSQ
ncbi:hypothetical protein OPIT5_30090 [Opitutaceae bacterium TAV5]|nr:hypothetical protein OPIT5_30090 [Opitutaceae bacterium TAV5]